LLAKNKSNVEIVRTDNKTIFISVVFLGQFGTNHCRHGLKTFQTMGWR